MIPGLLVGLVVGTAAGLQPAGAPAGPLPPCGGGLGWGGMGEQPPTRPSADLPHKGGGEETRGTRLNVSTSPDHRDALTRYGAALWQARRDRLLTAAKGFEAAARQDPDATAPLKELVRVYSLIGREPDAIRMARTILEKDPADVDTAHTLAKLLADAGEAKEAFAVAKLAAESRQLADRPDKALGVYRDLAALAVAAGDPARAEDALRKAIDLLTVKRKLFLAAALSPTEIDAETADTLERLGKVLVTVAKFDAAAEAFLAAHKLYSDPTRANDPAAAARVNWNLSGVYAAKGDPTTALAQLEAFLKRKPQAVEPFERLAALLRQANRGGEVVPALQKLAGADEKNLPLAAVLGAELNRDADTRRQADGLFATLYHATNDPKVVAVIVRSLIDAGRAGQVIGDLDQAYQATKGDDPRTTPERAFAGEKARVLTDLLRTNTEWANAVLRAALDDLRAGTKRTPQTWHVMAVLAARHRKLDLAAVQFRQAVRNAPKETEADAYAGLIDVLWRSRKPGDVVTVCREGLRSAEWTAPVFFNYHLAAALAAVGEGEEALATADKAIQQAGDGDRLVVRLNKAGVYKTLGRWDDAIATCRKLFDEFDAPADQLRIRYALANAYWGAKKAAESFAELRAILDADPDHAGACNDLGYYLADQGRDLAEAERLIRHALATDRADRRKAGDPEPENAAYVDSLGWVLFRRGNLAEARAALEKAAAMPDGAADAVVWDHLGDVYFRLGEKAKAKAAWEAAVGLYATDSRGKRDGLLDEAKRKLRLVP